MKIGIIADDLTGANATNVKLANQGFDAFTALGNDMLPKLDHNVAVCINTNSRYVAKEYAKMIIHETLHTLNRWEADLICKRIDSTFRGNIGYEIDTILDFFSDDAVVIISATYPDSGRVVIGGNILVYDKALQETDVKNDPIQKVDSSYIPNILKKQISREVGLIHIDSIVKGSNTIRKEIENLMEKGIQVIVCDAISEEHINFIASAIANIEHTTIIPADPGPLTNYYVKNYRENKDKISDKILVTIGSTTSVTEKQLDYFYQKTGITPIYIDPQKMLIENEEREKEISRAVERGLNQLMNVSSLVITTNIPNKKPINLTKFSSITGLAENELAEKIAKGLAEISKKLILQSDNAISGCFFSGGDVTAAFCQEVKAKGIKLVSEVMPLVAYGHLYGGNFEGLPIITKGGMVGDQQAIYECTKYLSTKLLNKRSVT